MCSRVLGVGSSTDEDVRPSARPLRLRGRGFVGRAWYRLRDVVVKDAHGHLEEGNSVGSRWPSAERKSLHAAFLTFFTF